MRIAVGYQKGEVWMESLFSVFGFFLYQMPPALWRCVVLSD